jgi:hypothetical protein
MITEKTAIVGFKMRNILTLLFLTVAYCAAGEPSIRIPRARPKVSMNFSTLLADNGELLRGAYWSTDWNGSLPRRDYLSLLKKLGLNTLHLYGESFAAGLKAGAYRESIDQLVRWTKEEGMYLVLTIGNWDKNGSYDLEFAKDFWSLYAPRYANEKHVVFELHNEPVAWSPGYPADALEMEKQLYLIVRYFAPDTPILLMSYAGFSEPGAALRDIKCLRTFVDFGNAAVAFHGYSDTRTVEENLRVFLAEGIPCINTEFARHDSDWKIFSPDTEIIAICERYNISWLMFQTFFELENDSRFTKLMESAKVKWKSDF